MTPLRPVLVSAVLGALAGAAALVFVHAAKPAIVLDMKDEPSSLVRGFHPVERGPEGVTFAWTRALAELRLPGLDRRSPWTVTIRVRGARPDPAQLPDLRVAVDGEVVSVVRTTNEFEVITVEVPASADNDRGAVITLVSSSTFVPGGHDARELGVMVDEIRVSPANDAVALPPRRAIGGALLAAGAFGGALAAIGLTPIVAVAAAVLIALGQAVVMARGLGPYEPYGGDQAWFAFAITLLLVSGVWIAERITGRRSRNTARFAVAFTAATLFLSLAALLHPSMPAGDLVFHGHRFEWVLGGRAFFTSPGPGGHHWPHPIALYVLAAPFTAIVHGFQAHLDLLRTVTAVALALAGLLVYLAIVRASGDRLAGAIACGLFHLVPLNFQVQAAGEITQAFAQSALLAALALVALGTVREGSWRGWLAGAAAATLAALGHPATFLFAVLALLVVAGLYAKAGGPVLRGTSRTVAWMTAAAVAAAVALFYGHFLDTWRELLAALAGAAPTAGDAARSTIGGRLIAVPHDLLTGYGLPLMALAAAGATWLIRRQQRDRLSLVLLAWAGAWALAIVLGVLTPLDLRPHLAFFPAVAMLGGIGAAWLWRRNGLSQVVAGLLLALVVARGVWEWLRPLVGFEL